MPLASRRLLLLAVIAAALMWGCGAHGPLEVVHSPTLSLPPHTAPKPLAAADSLAPTPLALRPLRIASYNVNFGMAGSAHVVEAIRASQAQVVFLQETTPEWQRFLGQELASEYPHQQFLHASNNYIAGGLAVLSQLPIRAGARSPSSEGWFDAWLVAVQLGGTQLSVLNVHLRPPLSDDNGMFSGLLTTRVHRQREIIAHLEALGGTLPDLVVGDFNEGPRGWAVRHLQKRGYQRALALHDAEGATWHWNVRGIPVGTQLDHVLLNAERLKCSYAEILNAGNSDHLPIVADVRIVSP